MNITEFAEKLYNKDLDSTGLKAEDLANFDYLKQQHDLEYVKWCEENPMSNTDDDLFNELEWVSKAILFFIEKGYIKNK